MNDIQELLQQCKEKLQGRVGRVGMMISARDVQLGDVIRLQGEFAFSDCIVSNVTADQIRLVRPYMTNENFTYTGGVIVLTGHETIDLSRNSDLLMRVKEGGKLK